MIDTVIAILQVAVGLGFVIFVHELGHFAVAKWCGVRCDKFFVGFDIGGYKLSRKWGETEYGIGILPLGGYVKMFGQEDNVAALEEELRESKALEGSPDAKEIIGPDGKPAWVHKRSYMAKTVPQRMAIISAGVIMNVIFAFVFAWVAFGIGVPEDPCVVGSVTPGGAAWRAGLRPGDEIVRLGEIESPSYKQLQERVMLGDPDQGVPLELKRAASGETEKISIEPDTDRILPMIGVSSSTSVRLAAKDAVRPHTPAAGLSEGAGFKDGDQIVAIDGEPITAYHELIAKLLLSKSDPITYTLIRGGRAPLSDPFGPVSGGESVEVTVGPNALDRLGIVPRLGAIAAVQAGSPAEEAGLQVGDRIAAVDGQEGFDPVTLEERFAEAASLGEELTLTVECGTEPVEIAVQPRVANWRNHPIGDDKPVGYPSLGVACHWLPEVKAVVEASPAEAAELLAGDRIVSAKVSSTNADDGDLTEIGKIELGAENRDWPLVVQLLQDKSADFQVMLEVERSGEKREVTLSPTPTEDFAFGRGVLLRPLKRIKTASNPGEQLALAWDETKSSLMTVFTFLSKIGGQVPVTALGGPITIAKVAGQSAFEGVGKLLLTLTMLSANLAVLNFLPIPVLDGGHMVFLAWEGLTGRPANERVVVALHSIGFLFLVSLMGFVFALDLGWIPRGL